MERNEVRPPVSHVIVYIPYGGIETSRIIRVDTPNYIILVAAVSQHVLVCLTRKVTLLENDMVLVLASKLTCLLCG